MASSLLSSGKKPSGFRPENTGNMRRVFIGLHVQALAAGAQVDLSTRVLERFAFERFLLASATQACGVVNIKIGVKPMNVSNEPISGNAFSEASINNELSGYTASKNSDVTVTLINGTAASVNTGGGFYGWSQL